MTAPTRDAILNALADNLSGRRWGAQPAIFFLSSSGADVAPRPDVPFGDYIWDQQEGSPAGVLALFVGGICNDPTASDRIPAEVCGLCFFSETVPVGTADRKGPARLLPVRSSRHIWATDQTGAIYEVSQTRRAPSVDRLVKAESDGWTNIRGTIPAAFRQFATTFLGAPPDLAESSGR